MRTAEFWEDYELIDTSCGERLERWGNKILIRPDPQIIWKTEKLHPGWNSADAHYYRSKNGGGHWENLNFIDESSWMISYKKLHLKVGLLGFKHTGVFPEQAVNWDLCSNIISNCKKQLNILNLFAYTGVATLACASAGAKVCHVDASKGMVAWARENAKLSGLSERPVRWIVDDCVKFVQREKKRGNKYDGIIMDPPSFGRGSGGEIWRLEDNIYDFINLCESIMAEDAKFFILNSYTTGLSPSVMEYMLCEIIKRKRNGNILSDEIGLKVSTSEGILPSGASCIWISDLNLAKERRDLK